jgi:hypothetical protein
MEKLADLIGALKDYFNDFVGAVIPGTALAAGILWLFSGKLPNDAFSHGWSEWSWLPGLAVIFLIGHALLSLNDHISRSVAAVRRRFGSAEKAGGKALSVMEKARANSAYAAFGELIRPQLKLKGVSTKLDFNSERNIAMSLSVNGAELGRRFMFISLFCYGTSTAAWVVAVLDFAQLWLGIRNDSTLRWTLAFSLIVTAFLLRRRGTSFELRALTVPFSVAIAELLAPMLREQPKSQEE